MDNYQARVDALEREIESFPFELAPRKALIELARKAGDTETMVCQQMDCAELHLRLGDQQAAIQIYQSILELEENESCQAMVAELKPEIYLTYGEMFLDGGQHDHAIEYLRASRDLRPDVSDTHMALARCYMDLSRHREAVHELQEVLRLTPAGTLEQALPCELLADVLAQIGQPARPMFERAAALYAGAGQAVEAARINRRLKELT